MNSTSHTCSLHIWGTDLKMFPLKQRHIVAHRHARLVTEHPECDADYSRVTEVDVQGLLQTPCSLRHVLRVDTELRDHHG